MTADPEPLWRMKLDRYDDYTIQVTADAEDKIHWQILGLEKDGRKDILKEMDNIPFQSTFDTGAPQHRQYKAEDDDDGGNPITKSALPFIIGLAVGGFAVYMVMQGKIKKYEMKFSEQAGTISQLSSQLAMFTNNGQGQGQQQQQQQQQLYSQQQPAPANMYSGLDFGKMQDYSPFTEHYPS